MLFYSPLAAYGFSVNLCEPQVSLGNALHQHVLTEEQNREMYVYLFSVFDHGMHFSRGTGF